MLATLLVHKRKRAHTCKNSCLGTCVRWVFVIVNMFAVGIGLKFCFPFVYTVFLFGSCVSVTQN